MTRAAHQAAAVSDTLSISLRVFLVLHTPPSESWCRTRHPSSRPLCGGGDDGIGGREREQEEGEGEGGEEEAEVGEETAPDWLRPSFSISSVTVTLSSHPRLQPWMMAVSGAALMMAASGACP